MRLFFFIFFIPKLTQALVNITVGLMLPYQNVYLKPKYGYATSAAACTIALERIRKEQLLPAVNFQFIWYFPECEESLAAGIAIKLLVLDKVDVIIGPPCSIAALVAGVMGKYYNIPLISWAATSSDLSNRFRFPTFARTVPSSDKLGEAVTEMLSFYGWYQFALIYTDDYERRKCYFFTAGLTATIETSVHFDMRHSTKIDTQANAPADQDFETFLDNMKDRVRIVIACLDTIEDRRRFLLKIAEKGLNTNDYVYIFPDYLPDENRTKIWVDYSAKPDGRDLEAKAVFQKSLVIELAQIDSVELHGFKRLVPRKMAEWPFFYKTNGSDEEYGSTYSPFMHDAMYLYGLALNRTLSKGYGKRDGRTIINHAKEFQFEGKSGYVVLGEDAGREPNFVIKGLMGSKYVEYGVIHMYKEKGQKVQLLHPETQIWASRHGMRPLDHPKCGWKGELCSNGQTEHIIIVAVTLVIFAVLILLAIALWAFVRHKLDNRHLQKYIWRVAFSELTLESRARSDHSFGSFRSFSRDFDSFKDACNSQRADSSVYFYKSSRVIVLKYETHVHTRQEHFAELRHMKDISHENVNQFIGLCIDGPRLMSIWRHGAKGSLQDVIQKEQLKLDWFFKYSLIRDLAEGLQFIHNSFLGSHGRLTSINCYMSDRWQLRISDYGLLFIHAAQHVSAKELLWTAPELLREEEIPPQGSTLADIYSFGIIVSEILTRKTAFSTDYNSAEEVVYRVRKGDKPACRPCVVLPEATDVNTAILHLMKDCWEEEPKRRPDLRTVLVQLKGMAKGHNANLMDHVLSMMEEYASILENQVNERTQELIEEKKKSDVLLYRMLPKLVADRLKMGEPVEPEMYENVTVFFSDVVGFTTLASKSTPLQVVNLLNELYTVFDGVIDGFDVYKVETIGDGYLCVSGLPERNGDSHVTEIADMSLSFLKTISTFLVPHLPKEKINLRIGINTGGCVTGVVGLSMPRYCLFGDTVNVASRMESHGKPGHVQMTEQTNNALTATGDYVTKLRGEVMVKGKGVLNTYWLLAKKAHSKESNDSVSGSSGFQSRPDDNSTLLYCIPELPLPGSTHLPPIQ